MKVYLYKVVLIQHKDKTKRINFRKIHRNLTKIKTKTTINKTKIKINLRAIILLTIYRI